MGVQNRVGSKSAGSPLFFVDPNRLRDDNASDLFGGLLSSAPISRLPNARTPAQPAERAVHVRPLEYAGPVLGAAGAFAAIAYFFGLLAVLVVMSMIAGLVVAGGIWVLNNTPGL